MKRFGRLKPSVSRELRALVEAEYESLVGPLRHLPAYLQIEHSRAHFPKWASRRHFRASVDDAEDELLEQEIAETLEAIKQRELRRQRKTNP